MLAPSAFQLELHRHEHMTQMTKSGFLLHGDSGSELIYLTIVSAESLSTSEVFTAFRAEEALRDINVTQC